MVVKAKFKNYFVIRRNVIFEQAKNNQWEQREDESIEVFITALHTLSEHCNYGDAQP